MKKLIIIFAIAFVALTSVFADITTRYLELIAIVPEVVPEYNLDVVTVKNGKAVKTGTDEYCIIRTSQKEKVSATFSINQTNDSRWKGVMHIILNAVDTNIMNITPVASGVVANNSNQMELEVIHNGYGKLPHVVALFTVETSVIESFVYMTYMAP